MPHGPPVFLAFVREHIDEQEPPARIERPGRLFHHGGRMLEMMQQQGKQDEVDFALTEG